MAVIAVTGAGTRALAWLFAEPGASRTVLDARIPYSVHALDEYVGSRAEQHVSAAEARLMADRSYWRALQLLAAGKPSEIGKVPAVGIGCTAAIATDRPKKGDHRCHVSVRTAGATATYTLTFAKGARDRNGEEEIVSRLVLNGLAGAFGVEDRLPVAVKAGEQVSEARLAVDDPLARLAAGKVQAVTVGVDGGQEEGAPAGQLVLAGSFNPVHEGHTRLAKVAAEMTGRPTIYEISVANVEKPDLTVDQLHARIAQFIGRGPIVVTRAATFMEKARLMPGSTFVVGYDTAVRLFDHRFYPAYDAATDPDHTGSAVGAAMGQLLRSGARFLVAGRTVDGKHRTLADIDVPPLYRGVLEAIPEAAFRVDVSSTEIRSREGSFRDLTVESTHGCPPGSQAAGSGAAGLNSANELV